MRIDAEPAAAPVRLADYQPPAHQVETVVSLTFRLDPTATRVRAETRLPPQPGARLGRRRSTCGSTAATCG